MHPSCKQSPRSEEPGRRCLEWGRIVWVRDWGSDIWESRKRKAGETTGRFNQKSKKLSMRAFAWINWASFYLFPVMEKQSLHPADGWLICTGGLLVAKTGYGVVEIRNSRDQNCQHGFQRFIFSMLSTAWYSLTVFFSLAAKKHPTAHQLTMEPKWAFRCILRIFSDWCRITWFVSSENHYLKWLKKHSGYKNIFGYMY